MDVDRLSFLRSVELAAVALYKSAGGLDRRVAAFAAHHQSHADSIAGRLGTEGSGAPAADETVVGQFAPLISGGGAAGLLALEAALAATHLDVLGALVSEKDAAVVAGILPVEAQHHAVLSRLLGMALADYLPAVETADKALRP